MARRPEWWNQSSNLPGAYQRVRVFAVTDFSGGLNFMNEVLLSDNESPDMMNVDVDRRGGFQVRRGVAPFTTSTLGADPKNLWAHISSAGQYLFAHDGNAIKYSSGGAWTTLSTSSSSTLGSTVQPNRAATFNGALYMVRGDAEPVKWVTGNATTMGANFNNDFLNPTSGNIPRAKLVAAHNGYLWVANTFESGTAYTCRVRWSHPNNGENWRADDYIDIDIGKDADEITAIMPIGDHLLVCKNDSIYAVYGYDFNSFSVVNVSNTIGCVSQEACAITQMGVAVFDRKLGVHMYDGRKGLMWLFEKLYPALRDNQIPLAQISKVRVGWLKGRLWVGVPWETSNADRAFTFVWSPISSAQGAWTRYDLGCGPFVAGQRLDKFCCGIVGTSKVMAVEQEEWGDDLTGSGTLSVIDAYYRTKWFDAGSPSMKKRWRRIEAVMQAEERYELPVTVNFDYDENSSSKTFKLKAQGAAGTSAYWGDGTTQATDTNWGSTSDDVGAGEGVWSLTGLRGTTDRGSGLGLCKSVSLTIGGKIGRTDLATTPVYWGVETLVFKFVPRRVR